MTDMPMEQSVNLPDAIGSIKSKMAAYKLQKLYVLTNVSKN